jgi:hypothetical protein
MTKDIIVFTLHKSASMFLHEQCRYLCGLTGMPHYSPNTPGAGFSARRLLEDRDLWRNLHGCFAPVRFYVDVPGIEKYDVILHLRDPRDVLVSMYYSYCFIHAGEIPGNTGYRREIADRGIDDFVLGKASERSRDYPGDYGTGGHLEDLIGNMPRRYADYVANLVGRPNVTLVKYEEMVTNYRAWLEKFVRPFALREEARVVDEMVSLAPKLFPKRSEDVMQHVRHVTPGDYRAKLQPGTIRQLDAIFADALEALGYERFA